MHGFFAEFDSEAEDWVAKKLDSLVCDVEVGEFLPLAR